MLYEKKIKYMEYRESGTKVKGAGFVKLERWGEAWNVLLQISGLPAGCTGEKGVYFCGGRKEVLAGLISMEQGRGRLELQEDDTQDPAEDGIPFAEAEMIRIPIGPEKEVVGILKEIPAAGGVKSLEKTTENRENLEGSREELFVGEAEKKALTEESPGDPAGAEDREGLSETRQEPFREELRENPDMKIQEGYVEALGQEIPREQGKGERPTAEGQGNTVGTELPGGLRRTVEGDDFQDPAGPDRQNWNAHVSKTPGREKQDQEDPNRKMQGTRLEPSLQATSREKEDVQENPQPYVFQAALQPDKWEQLRSIYPSVRPFGDDREYLRISPGDFVILKDRSYRLANNSFLLHGYFNYKHLILHRSARQGETLYFVGVPGNFYDKEKEVAILFGFESFECAREPAKEGDYGYYMMRVEL